jgi:bifunctional non-homologous end joining protein LigD
MLAVSGRLPLGDGWGYEFKWDGVRAIATLSGGVARLYARSGAEITAAYPELTPLAAGLDEAVLDGEIVVLDRRGRPSFTALAERMHVRDPGRAARLAATLPVTYMIFDLLVLDRVGLVHRPYAQRRAALDALAVDRLVGQHWLVPPTFADGPATLAAAEENALEGVVAKRLNSVYQPGIRSPDWIKAKLEPSVDLVVGGWRPGVRKIGALLVGLARPDGRLLYRGRVGGGISADSERALLEVLEPLRTPVSPFADELPREDAKDAVWVHPEIVVEVKYGQRTPDNRLRFPRFVRLRPDKTAQECTEEDGGAG